MKIKLLERGEQGLSAFKSPTQADVSKAVSKIVKQVETDEVDPIEAYIAATAYSELYEGLKKHPQFKSRLKQAFEEADRDPDKKSTIYHGATIRKTVRENPQYHTCGDSVYDELKKQEAELKKKIKARESFLRAIGRDISVGMNNNAFDGDTDVVSASTGEIIMAPELKTTESFSVTLPKK